MFHHGPCLPGSDVKFRSILSSLAFMGDRLLLTGDGRSGESVGLLSRVPCFHGSLCSRSR